MMRFAIEVNQDLSKDSFLFNGRETTLINVLPRRRESEGARNNVIRNEQVVKVPWLFYDQENRCIWAAIPPALSLSKEFSYTCSNPRCNCVYTAFETPINPRFFSNTYTEFATHSVRA